MSQPSPDPAPAPGTVRQLVLTLAGLAAAAALAVLGVAAARLLAPTIGLTAPTEAGVVGVLTASLALGCLFGGAGARSGGRARHAIAGLALLAAGATAIAGLVLIRWVPADLTALGLPPLMVPALAAAAVVAAPALLTGIAVAPFGALLGAAAAGRLGALAAVGALTGLVAIDYWLIPTLGTAEAVRVAAGTLAGAGVLVLTGAGAFTFWLVVIGGAAAAAAVTMAAPPTDAATRPCTVDGRRGCLVVTETAAATGRPTRALFINGHLIGIGDRDAPDRLHQAELAMIDRLVSRRLGTPDRPPAALTAILIGGGAFALPRAWAATIPLTALSVIEPDPAITRIARDALWLTGADGLAIHHRDPRRTLAAREGAPPVDLVVAHPARLAGGAPPPQLLTLEFARLVERQLDAERGVYALTLPDRVHTPLLVLATVRTLRRLFRVVEVWVDSAALFSASEMTFVVVAAGRPTPTDRLVAPPAADGAPERLWKRWPDATVLADIRRTRVPLLTDNRAPVTALQAGVWTWLAAGADR